MGAFCRERGAARPWDLESASKLPGLLRSPFATQGRTHNVRVMMQVLIDNALPLKRWQFKQWHAYSGGNCCATISIVTCPHLH